MRQPGPRHTRRNARSFAFRLTLPALLAGSLVAQTPAPVTAPELPVTAPALPATAPATTAPDSPDQPRLPQGQILIQSHGEPPAPDSSLSGGASPSVVPSPASPEPEQDAHVDVSDAEREALTVTSYDLDARLNLTRSGLRMRARLLLRNDGKSPLQQLPLQISSALRWESATLLGKAGRVALTLSQHQVDTDADHTGAATEAVLTLPEPLAPGETASLDLFYEGTIAQSDARLARLGASSSQGRQADWDAIGPSWTGLRGFGGVLWYPVAAPQLFLSEGNTLFAAIGRMRQQDEAVSIRLRLGVEYTGEPPAAAYFCGRRMALKAVADDPNAPTATGSGIATAEFTSELLGFRLPSLFVIQQPETFLGGSTASGTDAAAGPSSIPKLSSSSSQADTQSATVTDTPQVTGSSSSQADTQPAIATAMQSATSAAPAAARAADSPVLALVSRDEGVAPGLALAADRASGLLASWLGPRPLSAVTLLDHAGQPFQDGPLLVAPAATLETSPEAPALVYSLTHGWIQTGQPWMDEGLAQFFALLWVERETGRGAALNQLSELLQPVALAEPNLSPAADDAPGQPLISSPDEIIYRRKAAAVWWMLRDLVGEPALRSALIAWRMQPATQDSAQAQAVAFEHLLERESGKDLGWFFNDWVLRDRGLPDLSLTAVEISPTPAGAGHGAGFLLAATVRNEGAATADVPLIIRSGQFSTTQRMRIAGFGQTTQRVLVESSPSEVQVNDGSTPEQRTAVHLRQFTPASN